MILLLKLTQTIAVFYKVRELIIPIKDVFVPRCSRHAAGLVGLGVLVRYVCPSRQVDGLQRASSRVGGGISINPTHRVQVVMGQVFILEDRRIRDL